MPSNEPMVFIVDDDTSVRKSLVRLMQSVSIQAETFASAQAFLRRPPYPGPACLLLDIRMPGMSGLDLQQQLNLAEITLPIIFITGHGTIPMSVKAMKNGAVDFIEKPFNDQLLLDTIYKALEKNHQAKIKQAEINRIKKRLDDLTPREYEVFTLVVTGMINKQIALKLGTSEKTIKIHRSRVMKKMKADSLAELVRISEKYSISDLRG